MEGTAVPESAQAVEATVDLEAKLVWARERRERMKRLIREDPERALAEALTPREIAALDPEVRAEVEQWVGGKGFYGMVAVCGHGESDAPHGPGCAIRREILIGRRPFNAHVYGKRLTQLATENDSLYGVAVDGEIALHEDAVVVVEPEDVGIKVEAGEVVAMVEGEPRIFQGEEALAAYREQRQAEALLTLENLGPPEAGVVFDPANPPTGPAYPTDVYDQYVGRDSHQLGPKTLMVMVVKPVDGVSYGASPPSFATMDAQMNNLSQWYYNVSYKQTWFGPKEDAHGVVDRLVVTTELDLPGTVADYRASFSLLQADAKAAVEAQGGDWTNNGPFDPDRFDRWVVMAKSNLTSSTGLAYVGGKFSWTNGSIHGSVAYHELGHNWGVVHANNWVGDNNVPRNASGSHREYGDGADVMGGGGTNDFNPLFKEKLGFLYTPDGDILEASSSGTYRIFDHTEPEADKPATRARALKVPITGTANYRWNTDKFLMFSLRHHGGSDGAMGRGSWNRNALELHSDEVSSSGGNNDGSHFLDTTPGSRTDSNEDRDDGGLLVGRTYSEPPDLNGTSLHGEVHVTPVARGSLVDGGVTHEYMDVVVNLGDFSANQAPTASFTASSTAVDPGQTVTFTSTSTDPEGDPLAVSWTFGDDRYSYDNDGVQVLSWPTAGLYEVVLTVSDMKGGADVESVWINVGGIPSLPPVAPGATVAGLHYQYYEGSFSSMPDFGQLLPTTQGTVDRFTLSPKLRDNDYAFLFEGFLYVPASEVYTFHVNALDGAMLYVGGQLIVDNGSDKSTNPVEVSENVALDAGYHPIRLGFYTNGANKSTLDVDWSSTTATGGVRQDLSGSIFSQVDPSSNAAPSVAMTSPADGASVVVGNDLQLTATASDADGIEKVVYFAGATYIGESDSPPYSVTYGNAPTGTHVLSAVAYDSAGRWTQSAEITVQVVPPEIRRMISVNIMGSASNSEGLLAASEEVGAIYTGANWNNLARESDGIQRVFSNLNDSSGAATLVELDFAAHGGTRYFNSGETLADFSTPAGKMMRGCVGTRHDTGRATYEFSNIPYMEYDVYVYFDGLETRNNDDNIGEYELTELPTGNVQLRYGKNSQADGDGVGDYPTYDTFTGFKEATAGTPSAGVAELHGNYVVFRGVTTSSFRLRTDHVNTGAYYPPVNGIQIIEAPASFERVDVLESGYRTEVSETGAADSFDVTLSLPPTNGASVTVDLATNGQITVSPATLVFTAGNYDTPQTVTVTPVDDTVKEPTPHTGTVSFTVSSDVPGNYDGVTRADLSVAIEDDDLPTLDVVKLSDGTEAGPTSGGVRVARSGVSSTASPETFAFTLAGTATPGADYQVAGAATFDAGAGTGTAVIPGGADSVDLTFVTVDDGEGEGTETLEFALAANAAEYLIGAGAASLTLTDDEILLDEDFESFAGLSTGGWENGGGDFDWTLDSGGTPSTGTGPTVDHTTGTASGTYMFTESSTPNSPAKTASLLTPVLNLNGLSAAELRFYVHMHGAEMGTLHIDVQAGGVWNTGVHSLTGQQQAAQSDAWQLVSVDLTPYLAADTRIRFQMVTGSSYTSDAAIDDVVVLGTSTTSPEAPVIQTHPQSQNLTQGDPLVLSVAATGNPAPSYQWRLDGGDLPGATGPSYSVPAAGSEHAGTYTVRVYNTEGEDVSDPAVIQVAAATPPSFTLQPVGGTVDEGGSMTLTVAVTGYPAPELRWRRGGVDLSDVAGISGSGTATLVLDPADASMAGTYDCVAVNAGGTVPSDPAEVRVNTAPSIARVWPVTDSVAIPSGVGLILDMTVTDDSGTPTLTWSRESGPGDVTWDQTDEADTGVVFSADGEYVLRLSASDGALTTVHEVTVAVGGSGGGGSGFLESGGQVVIEAENYDQLQTGSGSFSGVDWVPTTALPGYSGASAMLVPNTGSSLNSQDTLIGPRMDYPVTFQTPGTYKVWVRILGASGNDDSVHAGLDGALLSGGGVGMSNSSGSWTWVDSANSAVTFTIAAPRAHVFHIWSREDGVAIDKIFLTTAGTSPSGSGPTESPFGGGNVGPDVTSGTVSDGTPGQASALDATVTDDEAVTVQWLALSGPGNVTFGDAAMEDTSATADAAGTYVLRLTADDGEVKTFDDLAWTVEEAGGPSAPTGLAATAVDASRIDLAWSDNSADETGFRVERALEASGPWSGVHTTAADATAYSDTGLSPDVYHYRVVAEGASGDSTASTTATASTEDGDGDGMLDDHEAVAGTSPSDGGDVLKVVMVPPQSGNVGFAVATHNGVYYRVTFRDSLTTGAWAVLPGYGNHAGNGNALTIEDTATGSRFYRIEVRNTPWP